MAIVFGFDVGISGFAAVVRKDNEFVWAKSFVLPETFGSTKKSAGRRRLGRTRMAHRAREWWWNQQASVHGIQPLKDIEKQNGDYRTKSVDGRLQREFPARNDDTNYTSCLLRCQIILDGALDLESWQIYKAVHSAIQKRGYDKDVPWKSVSGEKSDDEVTESERASEFVSAMNAAGIPEEYHLPCFYEAFRMGLWNPSSGISSLRQSCTAERGKGYTAPRALVEKEIVLILQKVKEKYPALDVEYVMWGPGKVSYASHPSRKSWALDQSLKMGAETDWHSLLGQKLPKFDNRIISKCALIPRFGVCKAKDELYQKFHLLKSLHNLRVSKKGERTGRKINHQEFLRLYSKFQETGKATALQLSKSLNELDLIFEGQPYAIEPAKNSGRSSFCRPALRILNEMLLEGKTPAQMLVELKKRPRADGHNVQVSKNTDPTKGLTLGDLSWLEKIQGANWEGIYIPQERLDAALSEPSKDAGILKAMANLNNPVVRHRLQLFLKTLREMNEFVLKKYKSNADYIAIEFIRDDFLGPKAKKELQKFQSERRKENEHARKKAQELGNEGYNFRRKVKLWERQGGKDPYDPLRVIGVTEIEDCEVDHIVPVELGGPDADYNVVLTRRDLNEAKRDKTPNTWLGASPKWDNYRKHITSISGLSNKTKQLLIADDALDLVERYQGLAETAWIARLAKTIIHIEMGWPMAHQGGERRVQVISGALTARVRGENGLNRLLNTDGDNKKNRADIRHHMLDAMVISFCREWARDPERMRFFKLPTVVNTETFNKVLKTHRPNQVPQPSELEENFYGYDKTKLYFHKKVLIHNLAYKSAGPGKVKFDLTSLAKKLTAMEESGRHTELAGALRAIEKKVLAETDNNEGVWIQELENLRLKNGSKPLKAKDYSKISDELMPLKTRNLHGIQLLKPKGSHLGFFICRDPKEKKARWFAKQVYCWQGVRKHFLYLKSQGFEISFFIRSGDYVFLENKCGELFEAGIYKVKTIMNGKQVFLLPLNSTSGAQPRSTTPQNLIETSNWQKIGSSNGPIE